MSRGQTTRYVGLCYLMSTDLNGVGYHIYELLYETTVWCDLGPGRLYSLVAYINAELDEDRNPIFPSQPIRVVSVNPTRAEWIHGTFKQPMDYQI